MTDPNWWRGATIYQIYPRSFQDSTGSGSGDLNGITSRLGHVADLRVDGIWISPIFTSPMADMGYDISNYRDIDPMFGTLEDFDRLIARAHELGLKVMIDQVLSHTSDKHPWFIESRASRDNPRADWYVWADAQEDGSPPTNWISVFGGSSWEWDSIRRQYYLHNFLAAQPDLNYHNPDVQQAMLDTVAFWCERGVDGFRLDACNYHFHDTELRNNPPAPRSFGSSFIKASNPYSFQKHDFDKSRPENVGFLERMRGVLDGFDGKASVGEIGDEERSVATTAAYTALGRLHMAYTFDLLGAAFSAEHIRSVVARFEAEVSEGWVGYSFSNHDVTRHVSRFARDGEDPVALAKFCIMVLAALRGTLFLYQGEELGLPHAEVAFEDLNDPYGIRFWPGFKGRDGCRTPMVWTAQDPMGGFSDAYKTWLPVSPQHLELAVDRQGTGSVMEHYKAVLGYRAVSEALKAGALRFIESEGDTLVIERSHAGATLWPCFNFGSEEARVPHPGGAPMEWATAPEITGHVEGNAVVLPARGVLYLTT